MESDNESVDTTPDAKFKKTKTYLKTNLELDDNEIRKIVELGKKIKKCESECVIFYKKRFSKSKEHYKIYLKYRSENKQDLSNLSSFIENEIVLDDESKTFKYDIPHEVYNKILKEFEFKYGSKKISFKELPIKEEYFTKKQKLEISGGFKISDINLKLIEFIKNASPPHTCKFEK